jgi:hypothetical protein
MKTLRLGLSVATIVLLAGGYIASQLAVFGGRQVQYAQQIDQPSIRMLALLLFLAAVVLSFIPNEEESAE